MNFEIMFKIKSYVKYVSNNPTPITTIDVKNVNIQSTNSIKILRFSMILHNHNYVKFNMLEMKNKSFQIIINEIQK